MGYSTKRLNKENRTGQAIVPSAEQVMVRGARG